MAMVAKPRWVVGLVMVWTSIVVSMLVPSMATTYTVGDASGWGLGIGYGTWTSDKTFFIGDTLVFVYEGGRGHTVNEVSSEGYSSCSASSSISSDSSGYTPIDLTTAGNHYFICASPGHCPGGMRLAVTVEAASQSRTTTNNNTTPLFAITAPPSKATV